MERTQTGCAGIQVGLPGLIPIPQLVLMCIVALAATAWGALLIAGLQDHEVESYLIELGVFGVFSALFVGSRGWLGKVRFFDIPTFITVVVFVEFGLAPYACLVTQGEFDPAFHSSYESFAGGLAYISLGMLAFWIGSWLGLRAPTPTRRARRARPRAHSSALGAPTIRSLVLYGAAFAMKAYFLVNFGYDYGTSQKFYFEHLAAIQVANVIFLLGTYALVILAIERSFHPSSLEQSVLFWIVFVSECGWGLLSGMKSNLLQNFMVVALVSSVVERRLAKRWVAAAVLGLVVVYPFSVQYRDLVRSRADDAMGFAAAGETADLALARAAESDSTPAAWLRSGGTAALSRVNLLQSVGAALALGPRAQMLKGDERWWMLPFYPFIPRFLWTRKPVLDKGRRFSVALGYGDQTATAITYPGDLLMDYGIPGLLLGMLLFGLAAQWLTKRLFNPESKRCLFIYTGLFITFMFMIELDAFDFWSTLIRTAVILSVVSWVVYQGSSGWRPKSHSL
jgi:hypothetical protein